MRWKIPENKQTIIKRKFLFLPLKIKNETRWLEFATIKYRCKYLYRYPITSCISDGYVRNTQMIYDGYKWIAIEFINE